MAAAIGTLGKLGIGTASTVTQRLDFKSESLKLKNELKDTNGVRGTRSPSGERVRKSLKRVSGNISLEPSSVEWSYLLQWILGGTPSGTTYSLAETLVARYVAIDRVAKVTVYDGVKVDVATFKCSQGEALSLELQLVGIDATVGNAGTFPAISLDLTTAPFMFHDLALVVAGTTYTPKEFELSINNMIDKERFFNSRTISTVESLDRQVTFKTNLPYGDFTAVLGAGEDGGTFSATFTNGTTSMAITGPHIRFPTDDPSIEGRTEVMLPIEGILYKEGTTPELQIVLDSTP